MEAREIQPSIQRTQGVQNFLSYFLHFFSVSNYYAWSHTEFITNSVNDTLLNGKRNLTELELVCPFMSRVQFTEDVFNGLTKLESLLLANCIFDSLTAKHFEDLPKLKNLDLINARFDHIDWLRCV